MELKKKIFAILELGAEKMTSNSFSLLREKRGGREVVQVEKMGPLFRCTVKGKNDEIELAFERCMECVT